MCSRGWWSKKLLRVRHSYHQDMIVWGTGWQGVPLFEVYFHKQVSVFICGASRHICHVDVIHNGPYFLWEWKTFGFFIWTLDEVFIQDIGVLPPCLLLISRGTPQVFKPLNCNPKRFSGFKLASSILFRSSCIGRSLLPWIVWSFITRMYQL